MSTNRSFFFGIGVQKGGTTTLHDILVNHSQICLPNQKETKYFIRKYDNDINLSYLEKYFVKKEGSKIYGEIDPDLIYYKYTADRILHHFGPQTKFIVSFRNPVERAISNYKMSYNRGIETLSFEKAIIKELKSIDFKKDDSFSFYKNHCSYINKGKYASQLNNYLELFPKENFLYLIFEKDILINLENTINRVQNFLMIDNEKLNTSIHSNESKDPLFRWLNKLLRTQFSIKKSVTHVIPGSIKQKTVHFIRKVNSTNKKMKLNITNDLKARLYRDYFKEEIELLEKMAGIDLSLWKKFN